VAFRRFASTTGNVMAAAVGLVVGVMSYRGSVRYGGYVTDVWRGGEGRGGASPAAGLRTVDMDGVRMQDNAGKDGAWDACLDGYGREGRCPDAG